MTATTEEHAGEESPLPRAGAATAVPAIVLLQAEKIVKQYPGTTALKGVDFEVYRGKINVLIGENGAGKSTLMKILAGVEEPTRGVIRLEGRPIRLRSGNDARRNRIAMVHQELNLFPNLSVAENIFAAREISNRFGWVDQRSQQEASRRALARLGSSTRPQTPLGSIALGDQQVVELARALAQNARILILDEPTSALSVSEVEVLFRTLAELKQQGVSIVYISHRLDELFRIGDFFTVLRDGEVAGKCERSQADRRWVVERMTGRSGSLAPAPSAGARPEVRLAAEKISLPRAGASKNDDARRMLLNGVSFSQRSGEVLGIFGLLGAGRTELLETLAGLHPEATGMVSIDGRPLPLKSPQACARRGLMLIPEDRKAAGLMLELSIRDNIAAAGIRGATKFGFVRSSTEVESIRSVARRLNLKTPDLNLPVSSLSGGNQQKVLLARCMLRSPSVLLLDEPTRGVDVGAKSEIYGILRQLASEGISILFTSSELEEIQALADRALVLCRGKIRCEQTAGAFDEAELLAAASTISTSTETGLEDA